MKITTLLGLLSLVLFSACELADFGDSFQENPNLLIPSQANPSLLLNNVQKEMADLIQDLNSATNEIMRYTYLNESYADVANQSNLNSEYIRYYEFLEDASIIRDLALDDPNLLFHRGMADILTSYATVTMVDYFGAIPFEEANRADEGILNPKADNGSVIYETLLGHLDSAITDITNATEAPTNDLFYGVSDAALSIDENQRRAWIKLAKSLQLKMLVNMADVDKINVLLAEDDFIDPIEDFEFQYSTNTVEPNSRHPNFNTGYAVGGFGQFIGNDFLFLLINDKASPDPRLRYYIYRQNNEDPSDDLLGCQNDNNFNFCYLGNSYYGRDHGDSRSKGADAVFRATYGLYPVGGTFDEDNPSAPQFAVTTQHQSGAGILPILLSSFVDFLRAEAALKLGTNDDARLLLESGIRKSMAKVLSFANDTAVNSIFAATTNDVDAYVADVLDDYDNANDQVKMDLILTEYYLASYGNSIESYNGYRRTGFPSFFTAPIFDSNTPFPRTFSLPEDAINNNNQLRQHPITKQVFWDKNPPDFIN